MKKIIFFLLFSILITQTTFAASKNHYDAWVGEWVELTCPKATVPFGWDAAIMHSYNWSVSSSNKDKVTFSRSTTPTTGITPAKLFDGNITITVKHSFYLNRIIGGQQNLKASSETHTFTISCKKVNVLFYLEQTTIKIGETYSLQYGYDVQNASPAPTVTFESDNTSIANVDSYGNVHALKEGTVTITAKTNYFTQAKCKIAIKPIDVQAITFPIPNMVLNPGQTITLNPNISPFNATYKELSWSSSDKSIATINNNGILTAVSPGFTEIKAIAKSGIFGTCYITVKPLDVAYIKLDKSMLNLKINETHSLIAEVLPENSTYKDLTWQSSNPEVATVDEKGTILALKEGTTNITAYAHNGISANCVLTVNSTSGIDNVYLVSDSDIIAIYTISGTKIHSNQIQSLSTGIYIIKTKSGQSFTISVK